jgi:hypothetical protein
LTLSLLDADMLTYPRNTNGDRYCIYGDPAYGLKSWLLSPYKGAQLTAGQQEFNRVMSGVRESVEWGFQRIVTYWAFVDYHKNQKLLLQPIGIYYPVCAILSNLLACYNSSQTAAFFQMQPPSPREYLHSQ